VFPEGKRHLRLSRLDLLGVNTMQNDTNEEWLSITEAAKYIGRSTTTVDRLSGLGIIQSKLFPRPGVKPQRRYLKATLNKWLAGRMVQGRAKTHLKSENRFIFQLLEGPILIAMPSELGETSLTIALDFLMLVQRQIVELREALEHAVVTSGSAR
jgi:hypothetical protein